MAEQVRRCIGSDRCGIEAHEAPIGEFSPQASQKDGLARMCKPHWREYTSGLRRDQLAREQGGTAQPTPIERPAKAAKAAGAMVEVQPVKVKAQAVRPATKAARAAKSPKVVDPKLVEAKALIDRIDALPGPESAAAMGTDEARAALALLAKGNGHRGDAGTADANA